VVILILCIYYITIIKIVRLGLEGISFGTPRPSRRHSPLQRLLRSISSPISHRISQSHDLRTDFDSQKELQYRYDERLALRRQQDMNLVLCREESDTTIQHWKVFLEGLGSKFCGEIPYDGGRVKSPRKHPYLKFFLTSTGMVGSVTLGAEIGDRVCVLNDGLGRIAMLREGLVTSRITGKGLRMLPSEVPRFGHSPPVGVVLEHEIELLVNVQALLYLSGYF